MTRAPPKKKPRQTRAVQAGHKVVRLDGCGIDHATINRKNSRTSEFASRRDLAIYDGRDCLGRIVVATNGRARAFDRRGKSLGIFESVEAASAAIEGST
jgi:hypothetical protein